MNENWVKIKCFDGYEVSTKGRIRSYRTNHGLRRYPKIITGKNNGKGYLSICLRRNNRSYYKYIHRIVAEHFIKNPENKPCVNHLDGNKSNNCIDNLEWCTKKENMKHAFEVLDIHNGEGHYKTKHTRKQILMAIAKVNAGYSKKEVAREFGFSKTYYLTRIIEGKRWKHII